MTAQKGKIFARFPQLGENRFLALCRIYSISKCRRFLLFAVIALIRYVAEYYEL
jgi:hypothetical protein